MGIQTGWLSPPVAIGGIDHLGTQTPCQLVYAQLMPGITNVTDRARYYSLYPWVIWSFDQRFPDADRDHFVRLFRRADFLLTLIAERHAQNSGEPDFLHGAAMAGRTQLPLAMNALAIDGEFEFDRFTTREDVPTRYFKQTLGGLGQYYVGTLAELRLLDTQLRAWVRYSDVLGEPLARAVDAAVPADRFWSVVTAGRVTVKDLEALAAFCPCGLRAGTQEYAKLEALFFAEGEHYEGAGQQRRLSLALLLHLAHAQAGMDLPFDVAAFRGAMYSGHLPGAKAWEVPDALKPTRSRWAIYQRNELLSVAFLSLFASVLDEIADRQVNGESPFPTIEAVSTHLAEGPLGDALEAAFGSAVLDTFLSSLAASAPASGDWMHADHEQQVYERLFGSSRNEYTNAELVIHAFQLLSLLAVRTHDTGPAYADVALGHEDLARYPINLESFRVRLPHWRQCTVREVFRDITQWCLVTHLSVALRKLRDTGRSTFRIHLGERGVEIVDETPLPTRTTPRFNQSMQVLIDLGGLRPGGNERHEDVRVTPIGNAWMARHGQ